MILYRTKAMRGVCICTFILAFFYPAWTQASTVCAKPQVSAGGGHSVGLRSDGSVVAVPTGYPQTDVGGWTDIIQIAAGYSHTVGLRFDGTVMAAGSGNYWGELSVEGWTNIIQVAAGDTYTVGLKADGTVVATGYNNYGQCDVATWEGIKRISCGFRTTLGLKSDGTVVAVGDNSSGQCDVQGLTDIVDFDSNSNLTVVLRADGTALLVHWGSSYPLPWENIVQVSAGGYPVAGLRSDGTVVVSGFDPWGFGAASASWTDIIQVEESVFHILGLKRDGTVLSGGLCAIGETGGWCNVGDWQLIAHKNVSIDIKPGSDPNSINLGSFGNVPVAILSAADFDATTVDPLSVTLAGAGAKLKGKGTPLVSTEDVNGDGLIDLIVHIDTAAFQLSFGDTEAILEAQTYEGLKVRGSDSVRIVR